ncbi:MAG: ABC transporter substrate-binding protein [Rhizobiaceae bacterium]|nr:ABC transporter substrate-binding protein [Rhizobiaceae bacterium]
MNKLLLSAVAMLGMVLSSGAQAQDQPLRIGVLTDQSSFASDLSGKGSVVAAQLAVEDFGGKVLGRTIEVLDADNQAKPDISSTIATRWYDNEGVDAIVDVPPSSAALAVQAVARDRGKIVMFSAAGAGDLIGKQCSPTGFQWTFGALPMAKSVTSAVLASGGKSWFYLTSDYAFGHNLEASSSKLVEEAGGKVLGAVRHPIDQSDMTSFLLQAQSSGADVIGLANSNQPSIASVQQAAEFGITKGKQRLVAMALLITDVRSIGIEKAQGLLLAESFYWDMNDETRAFSKRFAERRDGRMPTMTQAGVYSAVAHYLKAVAAAGVTDGPTVADKMRELPVKDFMTDNARIRKDGWVNRDFYLFQVKKPEESTGPWDLYNLVQKIPGDDAAPPMEGSGCPLVE